MNVLEENGFTDTRIPKPTISNALDISINIFKAVFISPREKHDGNWRMDFDIEDKIRQGQKGGWRISEVGWDLR